MANMLDELGNDIREEGLDVNVIAKKVPVTIGAGSVIFEIALWVLGIIPGIVFQYKKTKAENYLMQLEQKIQHNASQIDNYLEQRVVVLQNCARLLDKAIDLDKTTFENIAKYRSGANQEESRNMIADQLDNVSKSVNIAFEKYPDLKAHNEIEDAMKQNMYLQREITAARELYNDTVNAWNTAIFEWPTKRIVAARKGFTTRIPFIASGEMKKKARDVFF
ncbi:MAG: LemA family protein [Clostridia bacterium]|nr:LemA family protein [Clostridia bacterium]